MSRARPPAARARSNRPRARDDGRALIRGGDPLAPARRGAAHPARARATHAHPAPAARIAGLDALRGLAIVAMIVYHFCYDLRYFGFTRSDFERDWRWLTARTLILSSFLLIAGASAVLAQRQAVPFARWARRIALIAGAALLVSAASWLMFPRSYIWFGVLHAIAASLLLAQPLVQRPLLAALVGVAVIASGVALADPAFDNRALGWIGFMTAKPVTEDYVPLFPWAGVLFVGVAAGHWLVRTRFAALAPLGRVPAWLRWLGRHSLIVYLVHQPLLIGVFWLVVRLR
ncbi:MAG TPA: heparan-alpha-glucosaminide N-acetyltransferase [Casimicrobiaceae bacterium]